MRKQVSSGNFQWQLEALTPDLQMTFLPGTLVLVTLKDLVQRHLQRAWSLMTLFLPPSDRVGQSCSR